MGSIDTSNGNDTILQPSINEQSDGMQNGQTNGNHMSTHGNGQTNASGEEAQVAEPIAIIGMGMRLPGSIRDSETFWDFLVNKKSARGRVPENRYNGTRWVSFSCRNLLIWVG